jgi:leader peptidase (prepilin peptidase)/N-methyltransferase
VVVEPEGAPWVMQHPLDWLGPRAAWATAGAVPGGALLALAGVAGLVVGSFANVVAYRTPRHMSVVRPGSFCPSCSTSIRPLDNVPVLSWLVLGGRCRSCGATIAARYPLMEAGTGALFVLVALASGPDWSTFGLCALAAALAVSLAIELDGQVPPVPVVLTGAALGLTGLAVAAGAEHHWARFLHAAAGGGLAAVPWALLERLAPRTNRHTTPWWALVPAGVVLGWTGPLGAATGTAVLGIVAVARPAWATRPGRLAHGGPVGGGRANPRRARRGARAPALAAAAAAGAAVVAAVVAGAPLG